jgi:adenylate cyclase
MAASDPTPMTQGRKRSFMIGPAGNGILIGVIVFLLTSGAWQLGLLQPLELWVYDHYIQLRADPRASDPRIILVLQDEKDVEVMDHPLHDTVLSAVLEKIESGNPEAVGLDLYRDLPEPRNGSEIAVLNKTLVRYPNIITITLTGDAQQPLGVPPPPAIAKNPDRYGINDFPTDNGTVRRAYLFYPDSEDYESFAWMLAQTYLADHGITPTMKGANVQIGKTTLPRFGGNDGGYINAPFTGYQILLDFRSPQKFATLHIRDVLNLDHPEIFKDKIILIGAVAESLNDRVTTPMNHAVPEAGTLVHAQVVNQLLRAALDGDRPILSVSQPEKWIFAAVWCLAGIGCGLLTRSNILFTFGLVSGDLSILLLGWSLFLAGYWMPILVPMISFTITALLVKASAAHYEEQQRLMLMKIFSQHVSPGVAQSLWRQRDLFSQGGRPVPQRLTATVLFTDIKNFTTHAEKMETKDLIDWLNEYFTGMARQVEQNGGIINKYIGDGMMAVFGVPESRETEDEIRQDAIHAVQCALAMARKMDEMNGHWQTQSGKPQAAMRIGINTGELMAGGLGSDNRLEYTVIGDSVNTASRLESFDKEENLTGPSGTCRILIGGATCEYVKDVFAVELVGSVELKGKNTTTKVYKVIDFKNNSNKIKDI